jgi:MFS family permease
MTTRDRANPSLAYPWLVVGLLMIAYTLSFLDRQILALLVTDIQADIGISDTKIGLLQGLAFTIFYTTLGIPIARVADYRNRRNLIAMGVLLWSMMTMLCGFARDFLKLFIARMGVGVGEAALSPAAYSIITDYFPRKHLSKALSAYAMGVYIGGGIAFTVGGYLIVKLTALDLGGVPILGDMAGWQLAFVCAGLPGIFVAAAVYFLVREPERRVSVHATGTVEHLTIKDAIAYLSQNWRAYLPIYLGFSLHAIIVFAAFAWLPTQFIREFGFSVHEAGNLMGLSMLIPGCAGVLFGGFICDRLLRAGYFDAPLILGLVSTVGASVPFLVANLVDVSIGARTVLVVTSFFFMAIIAGPAPAAIQLVAPQRLRAQLSAVFLFSINAVGMTLGPLLPAVFSDKYLDGVGAIGDAMTWVIVIAAVAAAAVFLLLRIDYCSLGRASRDRA